VANLRLWGAEVEEFSDGRARFMVPFNYTELGWKHTVTIRIAMAFSIAGLIADGETGNRRSRVRGSFFPEIF